MCTTNTSFPQTNLWIPISPNRQRYSSDGKILLAAVLCLVFVVILVAALHLFVRSVLRHRRRVLLVNTPSSTTITASQNHYQTSSGLDPSVLAAIPTNTYRNRGEAPIECAVCLSAVEEGEGVRLLPGCKHAFHVSCIDMWLHAHCTCPVCRASVELSAATAACVEEGTSSTGAKEGSSGSRLGSSFRMMLSGRQWSGRRGAGHGDGGGEDLERP